jgi:transcriptional regulator with XRE-family HTH domain
MVTMDVPDLKALGVFIRDRRRALDLTQVQLAGRLGWNQERISALEHGRCGTPSLPALARLARSLDIHLSEILQAAGYTALSPNDLGLETLIAEATARLDAINHLVQEQPLDGKLGAVRDDLQRLQDSLSSLIYRVDEQAERHGSGQVYDWLRSGLRPFRPIA